MALLFSVRDRWLLCRSCVDLRIQFFQSEFDEPAASLREAPFTIARNVRHALMKIRWQRDSGDKVFSFGWCRVFHSGEEYKLDKIELQDKKDITVENSFGV